MTSIDLFETIFKQDILDETQYLDEFSTYLKTCGHPDIVVFIENTMSAIQHAQQGFTQPLDRMATILNEYLHLDGYEKPRAMATRLIINSGLIPPHLNLNAIAPVYYLGMSDMFIAHDVVSKYQNTFEKWDVIKNTRLEHDFNKIDCNIVTFAKLIKDNSSYDYVMYVANLKQQVLNWAFRSESLMMLVENSKNNINHHLKDMYSRLTPLLIKHVSEQPNDVNLLLKAYVAYSNTNGFEIRPFVYGTLRSKEQVYQIIEKTPTISGLLALTDINNPLQALELMDTLSTQNTHEQVDLPLFEL